MFLTFISRKSLAEMCKAVQFFAAGGQEEPDAEISLLALFMLLLWSYMAVDNALQLY